VIETKEGPAKAIVVVVESECQALNSLGVLLSSAGYDARLFSSGEEFLANPYIRTAACLISDADLRGMSGIDLLRRIEAQGIKLPCILLAGSGETDWLPLCLAEGVRFLFPKPILGVELLAAVAVVTNSFRTSGRIGFARALRHAVGDLRKFICFQWRPFFLDSPGNTPLRRIWGNGKGSL